MIDTPAGRLLGHDGAIPGFLNVVLSTEDGRRQVGVMMNEEFSSPAVSEAFSQVFMTLAMGLLDGARSEEASANSALGAAVRAGVPTSAAATPKGVLVGRAVPT